MPYPVALDLGGHKRASQAVTAAISEKDFLKQVLDLAQMLGWRRAHFRPALTTRGWRTPVQGDGQGFPDLLLIRKDRVIAAELKAATGRLTAEQQRWLDVFEGTGKVETYVWRCGELDQVAEVLR